MSLSPSLLRAIGRAVRSAGGDVDDARALSDAWRRLERTTAPRVDAMRREAAAVRCCCVSPGKPEADSTGRCPWCYGLRADAEAPDVAELTAEFLDGAS